MGEHPIGDDLRSKLARAIGGAFPDKKRRSRLEEYVFGDPIAGADGPRLVSRAYQAGVVADLYAAALLLSGNDRRLAALRDEVSELDNITLERRLTQSSRYLEGAQLIDGIPRVCRVEVGKRALGSGFLVAPDLIVTNYHVLSSAIKDGRLKPGNEVVFRFDCLRREVAPEDGKPYLAAGEGAIVSSSGVDALDYALVRIGGNPGEKRGWFVPEEFELNLDVCDYAYLIQYPDGNPVRVSDGPITSRHVLKQLSRVLYLADTEGGSSGAPCIQRDGRLLALHRGSEEEGNQGVFFPAIVQDVFQRTGGETNLFARPHVAFPGAAPPVATVESIEVAIGESVVARPRTRPEPPPGTQEHWTESAGEDGWWYKPDPDAPDYRPEMLIVLVHGFLGDCVRTWGDIHIRLQKELKLSCDVFTYNYPAGLTEKADIREAGKQLGVVLEPELERYQHLLVLAHSAGGLVVKEWLCRDADSLAKEIGDRRDGRSETSIRDLRYAILAVRQIVNFDVPHAGGDDQKTWLGGVAYDGAIWPALWLGNRFGAGFGYNQIVEQLRHHGPFVTDLENRYVGLVRSLEGASLPRPVSIEFLAAADTTIAPFLDPEKDRSEVGGDRAWVRSDADSVEFRRTHSSVKNITASFDAVLRHLRHHLDRWRDGTGLAVALESLCRADEFLLEFRCRRPFGVAVEEKRGPQASMDLALKRFIAAPRQAPARAVVTGAANVGKSVLSRFLTRDYCLQFLRISDRPDPLPLFFQMPVLPLETPEVERDLAGEAPLEGWHKLLDAWCRFAEGLVAQGRAGRQLPKLEISRAWVEEQLHAEPCLLILDAIDEFFDRHRNVIEVNDLRKVIVKGLEHKAGAGHNPRVRLVQFVRETLPDCETLALEEDRYRLREPNVSEADEMFPGFGDDLERVPEALRPVVSSPLLLPILARHLRDIEDDQLQSEGAIYKKALLLLIRDSQLLNSYPGVTEQECFDVISVMAWHYYVTRDYVLAFRDILSAAAARIQAWSHPVSLPDPAVQQVRARIAGLMGLMAEPDVLQSILQKTIFVKVSDHPNPAGPRRMGRTYRILHENWIQQLGAQYLASCIAGCQPGELSFGACTEFMFRMAGEELKGLTLSSNHLDLFIAAAGEAPYVLGNLVSTINVSRMELDGPVLRRLFTSRQSLVGITQLVFVVGLGLRALRWPEIYYRRSVIAQFQDYLRGKGLPPGVRLMEVTRSVVWCYLKRLEAVGDLERPRLWDGLQGEPDKDVVALMCDFREGVPTITTTHKALQRAFVEIHATAAKALEREITFAHYLYVMAVAVSQEGYTVAMRNELLRLLAEDSPIVRRIAIYGMPELEEIMDINRGHCGLGPIDWEGVRQAAVTAAGTS